MARKFKFKPAKITHSELCAELQRMGFDEGDRSLLFCEAENDGGEFPASVIEDAQAEIAAARSRILQQQEDAQFEAWLAKTYPIALAA